MSEPVWEATVDNGTWRVTVGDDPAGGGVLTVIKVDDGSEILREHVGLVAGARFGPDVADVQMWQVMAIDAIDHYNAQQGNGATE